ncbi:MAG TPA: hypothetical protein VIH99_04305 [Bdellovibrionota bacterium]|jgi:hypothetical protein
MRIQHAIYALVAFVYACLALNHLHSPALFQDEAAFVPVSLGIVTPHTSARKLFGILIFEMDYVGALKAWINTPVYKMLGISIATIRVPIILTFAFSLMLIGVLLERLFGFAVALGTILLLGLNPNIIALTRADFVPFALSVPIKVALLYHLWRWDPRRWEPKRTAWIVSLVFLGIYHRIDFLWTAAALVVAYACLSGIRLGFRGLAQSWKALLTKVLFLGGTALLAVVLMPQKFVGGEFGLFEGSVASKVVHLLRMWRWNVEGSSFSRWYLLVWKFDEPLWTFRLMLTVFLCPILIPKKARGILFELSLFCWVATAVIFTFLLATKRAGAPHHLLAMEPIWELGVAAGVAQIFLFLKPRLGTAVPAALVSAFTICWGYAYGIHYGHQLAIYDGKLGPVNPFWSEKMYEIVDFRKSRDDQFIFLGWGVQNAFTALTNDFENSHEVVQGDPLNIVFDRYSVAQSTGHPLYVVTVDHMHRPEIGSPHTIIVAFRKYLKEKVIHAELVKTVSEGEKILFSIYRIGQVNAYRHLQCGKRIDSNAGRVDEPELELLLRTNLFAGSPGKTWSLRAPLPGSHWLKAEEGWIAFRFGPGITSLRKGKTEYRLFHPESPKPLLDKYMTIEEDEHSMEATYECLNDLVPGEPPLKK